MRTHLKNKHSSFGIWGLALVIALASCTSLGETRLASSINTESLEQVKSLEAQLPLLIANPNAENRRLLESDINKLLSASNYNKSYQARLWGLLAEIAWLYQDRFLLEKAMREMDRLDREQVHLIIAKARLASPKDQLAILENAIRANPDNPAGELKLELALSLFAQNNFLLALAYFDDAFASLSPAWVQLYAEKRELAYRQKDAGSSVSQRERLWLTQNVVTREALLGLLLTKTKFLDVYGKEYLEKLSQLNEKLESDERILKDEKALNSKDLSKEQSRAAAAYLLFHLAVQEENRSDLLTGGKTWKASPIPDVALDSAAFRAIIGIVQREILNLRDGTNFMPNDVLLTSEYLSALERMKSLYP